MQGQPTTPTTAALPGTTLEALFPELRDRDLYQASPSFLWAEATLRRLWQRGYRPLNTTHALRDSPDWYTDSVWYACKSIIASVKYLRSQVELECHAGAAIEPAVLEGVIREVLEAMEVTGSVGFHYLDHAFEIAGRLPKTSFFIRHRRRAPERDKNGLKDFKRFVVSLESPFNTRRGKLLKFLEGVQQDAAAGQDHARIEFTRDWTSALWENLKVRTSESPDLLNRLEHWLRIYHGLYRFKKDPLLASSQPDGPERWRLLKFPEIKAILSPLLVEEPPEYSVNSLRREPRIGLRQVALRPDLKVLGLARHGGYLF